MRFLLIASFAESLLIFRGPFLAALVAKGIEVHVAAPGLKDGSGLRLCLERIGLQVHNIFLRRTGTNPVADAMTLLDLWRLIRRICPHVVLGYTIKPVIYGSLAAWMAGTPSRFALITGLGYAFQSQAQGSNLQALVHLMYTQALAKVHLVFFQNPDDENLFRQRGLLQSRKLSCIVNGSGVDLARFSVAPLPPGPVRFLLIARLLGHKGVREYAAAAKRVRDFHPEVRFSLVGFIDENPDAISPAEFHAWVACGTVDYLGRLADVRPAIAACSVYVLPSYSEGTPRTVLEAMAMGRPIITTDTPGCRETVVDGVNGFLVPVKSVEALEKAMLRFIQKPELMFAMGKRSRQIAEHKYDVHKVNAVMIREMGIQ